MVLVSGRPKCMLWKMCLTGRSLSGRLCHEHGIKIIFKLRVSGRRPFEQRWQKPFVYHVNDLPFRRGCDNGLPDSYNNNIRLSRLVEATQLQRSTKQWQSTSKSLHSGQLQTEPKHRRRRPTQLKGPFQRPATIYIYIYMYVHIYIYMLYVFSVFPILFVV